jgi:integrase
MNEMKFKELCDMFLKYKISLGYSYTTGGYDLRRLIAYTDGHYPDATGLSKDIVKGFLEERSAHEQLESVASTLREFGRYLILNGHTDTYLIPENQYKKKPPKPPYFFTPDEIERFFFECDSFQPSKHYPGRHIIIPAVFRLMYCCGLRSIEIRKLKHSDFNFGNQYFDVLRSKGHIDRRLYLTTELSGYLDDYNRRIAIHYPNREYFFPGKCKNGSIGENMISGNFARAWDKAFPGMRKNFSPRAYDFRHHLAYYNINKWVREGNNVDSMTPYLMRYMGHKNIKHTLYYFHFVPGFYNDYKNLIKSLENLIPEVDYEEET